MIGKTGVSVRFYAFFVSSKQGVTGLTVTVDVYQQITGGASSQVVTGASATEIGGGLYAYAIAAGTLSQHGEYVAIFKTTGTADQQWIPALWATPSWVDQFGAAPVTMTGPVALNGNIQLVHGDDYFAADNRSLDFTFTNAPSLTGAGTVKLSFKSRVPGSTAQSFNGTVLSATQLRFELTAANTAGLTVGDNDYDIEVLLSGSTHATTLQRGYASVLQDITP